MSYDLKRAIEAHRAAVRELEDLIRTVARKVAT